MLQCGRHAFACAIHTRHGCAHDTLPDDGYARRVAMSIVGLARDGVPRGKATRGGKIMSLEALIIWLIVGALAGWIAGLIVKGYGFGLIGNIIVGIIGAGIAGWLLPRLGIVIGSGVVSSLLHAFIGPVILPLVSGLIRR